MAVAMLVIVSAAVLPAAVQAYQKAVDAANAHALLSIAVDALRDEFSMARSAEQKEDGSIIYQNTDTGDKSKLYKDSDGKITRLEYRDYTDYKTKDWLFDDKPAVVPKENLLISDVLFNQTEDKNKQMIVTYKDSSVENGFITINKLTVQKNNKDLVTPVDIVIHYLGGETA